MLLLRNSNGGHLGVGRCRDKTVRRRAPCRVCKLSAMTRYICLLHSWLPVQSLSQDLNTAILLIFWSDAAPSRSSIVLLYKVPCTFAFESPMYLDSTCRHSRSNKYFLFRKMIILRT